jgi:hypothetical protein
LDRLHHLLAGLVILTFLVSPEEATHHTSLAVKDRVEFILTSRTAGFDEVRV